MPEEAEDAWPALRLWQAGKATLTELERMSLDDVEMLNGVLDACADAERRASMAAGNSR